MIERINKTVNFLKNKVAREPETGVILGSGLGNYVDTLEDTIEISYNDIPGFHVPTVIGHAGKLVFGKSNGKEVVVMQGRYHAYEGHHISEVVFPTRVLGSLGVKNLILTNASGGINKSFKPGELVIITDHINMTGLNPLVGKNIEELGTRFPDMTNPYNLELIEKIKRAATRQKYEIKSGIYAAVLGPSYETPAEINMLGTLGADLVGMSTAHECIAANHMGLKVAGVSCVTNMAAGISDEKLSHDDVKVVANIAKEKFANLLNGLIQEI